MKTIFIIIPKDIIRRNILDTDFWPLFLKQNKQHKIVLIVDSNDIKYYKENYVKENNVVVEGYRRTDFSFFGRVAVFFARNNFKSNGTTMYRWRAYTRGEVGILVTLLKEFIASTFGRLTWTKHLVRFLFLKISVSKRIVEIYDKYNPNHVVVFSIIDNDFDIPFSIIAKRRGIRLVGMVRSWDNLSIHNLLAVIPDKFIFQNIWLKKNAEGLQAIDLSNLSPEIVGLPHYDSYVKNKNRIIPRNEFMKGLGIDPSFKLIFFGSVGFDLYPSETMVPEILNNIIKEKSIKYPSHVLFRTHPGFVFPIDDCKIEGENHIVFDDPTNKSTTRSFSDTNHFINSLAHADVVINPASTLSIDAACFDKPVICINFDDPKKKLSYWESINRLYDSFDHYEELLRTCGVRLSNSKEELIRDINMYLEDPSIDKEGRKRILEEFVEPFDGRAGERLANIITSDIAKTSLI